MRIRNQKDFWAGVMFFGFGIAFAGIGTDYAFGTAARMGPGYFPMMVSGIMILLGLLVAIRGLSPKAEIDHVEKFAWSTLLLVLGPIVLFGLLLDTLGLALSLLMLIGMSSYASHEFSWKAMLGSAVILISVCLLVFVYALNLQFQILPSFLGA